MLIEELNQVLHKVLMSQISLDDLIHDLLKCEELEKESLIYAKKKYKFWEKAEKILRNAIAEIEEEWEKLFPEDKTK